MTQSDVAAGGEQVYEFTAAHPGTYWFHPHHGTQLGRGLDAPLIVEDPDEPLAYDDEWVVVLDDWLDEVTGTPDEVLAELKQGMGGMGEPSSGTYDMPGKQMETLPGMAMGTHALMGGEPSARRRCRQCEVPALSAQRPPRCRTGDLSREAGDSVAAANHQRRR